jgi:ATP-dependent phosphofructokinase / diphosphate-dependent phosphofructokinase
VAKIREREAIGKHFTLVAVAEGARPAGGEFVTAGDAGGNREARLGGIGQAVAAEIEKRTGKECRTVVLGHLQRGGAPTAWDRQLCTRFGVFAVELIAEGRYGAMVALKDDGIGSVLLTDAIDRIRTVPPDGELVRMGRALGISFGNEAVER